MEINFTNHTWLSNSEPIIKNGYMFFGNPVFPKKKTFSFTEINGIWLALKKCNNSIELISDVCGSIRTYFKIKNNILYLFDLIEEPNGEISNSSGYSYFKENGYFFGSDTFDKRVHRLQGLVLTKISKKGITTEDFFFKIPILNFNFKSALKLFLTDSINLKPLNKSILMFSGGADSVFLANALKELEIDFKAVFFDDGLRQNERERAIKVAKSLNIDFEIIYLDINNDLDYLIQTYQRFDSHYSKLHFFGAKVLYEKYGSNINVINGQGSDSVLSLGPSEFSIQSFFKRIALNSNWPFRLLSNIFLAFVYNTSLYLGFEKSRFYESFSYFKRYLLVNKRNSCGSFKELVCSDDFQKANKITKLLSIKRLGFLMGSDNQVVINSLKHFNFTSIILPFSSVFMFSYTIANFKAYRNIFYPKYIVRK